MSTSVIDYVTSLIMIFTNYKCGQIQFGSETAFSRPLCQIISGGQLANLAKFLRCIGGKVQTCFLKEVICFLIFPIINERGSSEPVRISQRTKHRDTVLLDCWWNIRQDGVVEGDDGCIDGWMHWWMDCFWGNNLLWNSIHFALAAKYSCFVIDMMSSLRGAVDVFK